MEKEVFNSYMDQVQKYPLLSYENEVELSRRIESGDSRAKMLLVQSNLRLVVSIAKKLNVSKDCMMDLIQEGNLGLITAAAKFHYSFKTRFSTYAYSWIMQYMLRYLHNRCTPIALPHRKDEVIRHVATAEQYLLQQTGHQPSLEELSVYMGLPEKTIKDAMQYAFMVTSLDSECGEDDNSSIGDLLPDSTYSPEKKMMDKEGRAEVFDLINTLPEKEQKVIYHRYNFACEQRPKTLREISSMLGVSAETIRQMELRALRRMRANVAVKQLSMVER
ncbi:MAG: sigma-70 family RNA polymerase sigma factor [Spirochaetaceae bacterium]|nr:sigma-70 family RNA polymerase sigma factor [Spirochaetaceae bacterium]